MINNAGNILISYPSGGFGNFIFHVLTEFSDATYKSNNSSFKFSNNGNSHSTFKYTNTWFHDPVNYQHSEIETDKKIIILCDNGINNDSYINIKKQFINPLIIRACITPAIRPIIYKTCVTKAQKTNVIDETKSHVDQFWHDSAEPYAVRENFTLLYHRWPFKWEPLIEKNIINLDLESLILNPVESLTNLIQRSGGNVIKYDQLQTLCDEWKEANGQYFEIYYNWIKINNALDSKESLQVDDIINLHDQGYLNYCIENKYSVTIPVYDYKDWFKNTKEILYMINKLKYVQN